MSRVMRTGFPGDNVAYIISEAERRVIDAARQAIGQQPPEEPRIVTETRRRSLRFIMGELFPTFRPEQQIGRLSIVESYHDEELGQK